MSHECNCGCSSENNSSASQGLQITTRDQATPLSIQTELKISGMTCGHCVASVTEELKELSGVQNVDVVLDANGISTATVTATEKLTEENFREAIDEAGYTLEAINA